ncbi:(Fe-S)-binding protein [Desulfospira joergensenii]|uniref:(Fe-S)-binding protein n=1 Tax=Desulfospira joergensenii TaxID=53329 RepID=UPI0003B786F0|nr:(Fe-S)-binding protein [Desulfospira joergensenii]
MTQPKHITLFIQCIVDGMYPEAGEAMVTLFRRLGFTMDFPEDQTCCGQPAFNSGYRKEARKAAKHFIRVFENSEVIVCPSGSCVAMVRHHYPELFRDDPVWLERAEAVGKKVFELTEFIVDILNIEDVGGAHTGKVTYHDSCHLLRTLGIKEQPRSLIRKIKGIEFVEMKNSDHCCGFGGAFSTKYPDISTAMVAEKVQNILDTGADTVVGCDMGCLMNIQGYLNRNNHPVRVMHIAQLLAGQEN